MVSHVENKNIKSLCQFVKKAAEQGQLAEAEKAIAYSMQSFPHSPAPHNLMGIVSYLEGDSSGAVKHFKAACALCPGYAPSIFNLEQFAKLNAQIRSFCFDEAELQ